MYWGRVVRCVSKTGATVEAMRGHEQTDSRNPPCPPLISLEGLRDTNELEIGRTWRQQRQCKGLRNSSATKGSDSHLTRLYK